MTLLGEGEAEAEDAVRERRREEVVANSRAAVSRDVVPAATTTDTVRARRWTRGIGLRPAAIIFVPVLTPLPYVAAHVVDTQFV